MRKFALLSWLTFIERELCSILLAQSSWSYPWYNLPLESRKGFKVPFFTERVNLKFYRSKLYLFLISSVKNKSWLKQNLLIFICLPKFKHFSGGKKEKGWLHFVERTFIICWKVDQVDFFVSLLKGDNLHKSVFTFSDCLKTALPLQSIWWGI